MKSTGMVRRIDELGRIVLPIEIRRSFGIDKYDSVEIFVENEQIILKKYEPTCIFCGSAGDLTLFKGKLVCSECLASIKKSIQK